MRIIIPCLLSVLSTVVSIQNLAQAQEQNKTKVVVSAHRFDTPVEKVASAVTVITSKDIENLKLNYVHEVLKTLAFVDVVRSGGKGGNTSVFMRGTNPEHTLVLLDGIELNNPVSTAHAFNFDNLTVDNIDRIEILRGSQSLLYGSDALGGVIAIYTKDGSQKQSANLNLQGGSFDTFKSSANLSGKQSNINYALAISREDSGGISSAASKYGNSEDDAFDATSLAVNLSSQLTEQLKLKLINRYTKSNTEIDNTGGVFGDDPNRELDNRQVLFRTEALYQHSNNSISHQLGFSITDQETEDNNDPDANSTEYLRSNYEGRLVKFDLVNNFKLTKNYNLLLGLETEEEIAESQFKSDGAFGPFEDNFIEQDIRNNAGFSELQMTVLPELTVNLGARIDDNGEAGSESTYRVAPVLCLNDCEYRVTSTIGTGFKAPSLFQLYSSYGNKDLEPEDSFNWEIGLEKNIVNKNITIGVNWFRNKIDNLITFDNQTFKLENIDSARIYGVETFMAWQISDTTTWRLDYTYTDTKDLNTQEELLRRAKHKLGSELSKTWLDSKLNSAIQLIAIGSRSDTDFNTFPSTRVDLSGYLLANVSAGYKIRPNLELFARVDNLLDQDYEDVLGYGTYGLAGYVGLNVSM